MLFQPESQEQAFATETQRAIPGFIQSLLVMLLEFGDRTFFIASCLSGKHDPKEVFWRAIAVADDVRIGRNRHGSSFVDSRKVVHYGSVCLFVFYGARCTRRAGCPIETKERKTRNEGGRGRAEHGIREG